MSTSWILRKYTGPITTDQSQVVAGSEGSEAM
jgi:hypothetical protein